MFFLYDSSIKEGKYGEALGKWENALTLMPNNAVLHEQKAQVLLEIGDAWSALKAATRAAPSSIPFLFSTLLDSSCFCYGNLDHSFSKVYLLSSGDHSIDLIDLLRISYQLELSLLYS